MTTRRFLLTAGAALLAAPALPRGAAAQVDTSHPVGTLRFVSGPTGGAYFPLGEGAARAMNTHTRGARAASTPTSGSTENVRLISLGEADFGWPPPMSSTTPSMAAVNSVRRCRISAPSPPAIPPPATWRCAPKARSATSPI